MLSVQTEGVQGQDPGLVYILTNAAMPNHVKIGLTRKDDMKDRLRQLWTTGVPVPFEVAYSARVPDCGKLERVLHKVFDDKRVRPDREFFTADPELAQLIIDLVKVQDRPLSDEEQGISPEERTQIETEKERHSPRMNFDRLGLPVGTVLTAIKDASITCEVAGPGKVLFQGQVLSPSRAALIAVRSLGYQWSAISGSDFWTHEGVKLSVLAKAKDSEEDVVSSGPIPTAMQSSGHGL